MSAPVPSPSMKGMIGLFGTVSLPLAMVIFAPSAGTLRVGSAMCMLQGRDAAAAGAAGEKGAYCRGLRRGVEGAAANPPRLPRIWPVMLGLPPRFHLLPAMDLILRHATLPDGRRDIDI